MVLTRRLIRWLAFISTLILALQYNFHKSIWYALSVAILGGLWVSVGSIRWTASTVGFLSFSLLIAMDVYQYGITMFSIITIHTALALWDLLTLHNRLGNPDSEQEYTPIIQSHLIRLGVVLTTGFVLSVATLYLKMSISLGVVIVCGLVLMVALSRVVKHLRINTT